MTKQSKTYGPEPQPEWNNQTLLPEVEGFREEYSRLRKELDSTVDPENRVALGGVWKKWATKFRPELLGLRGWWHRLLHRP